MTHNFWTEFDNSDHTANQKRRVARKEELRHKKISLAFASCYCLGLSQEFIEILKEAPAVAESIIA
jgi:hypothetical protein